MGAAAAAGGTTAYALAPNNEKPMMHAAFGASIGAAAAAIVGLFIFDEQKRSSDLERQVTSMKQELDRLQYQGEPELVQSGSEMFEKSLPGSFGGLMKPGHWRRYKMDKWVEAGENRMIHQDKMFEIIPPVLNPKPSESNDVSK